jgi:hypothetical protein
MPTTDQLAAALRDVLPYAYAHAMALEATHNLLGTGKDDAALATQRCEAAAALLGSMGEKLGDMPPVMAKVRPERAYTVLIECTEEDAAHYGDGTPYVHTVEADDCNHAAQLVREKLAGSEPALDEPYEDMDDATEKYTVLAVFNGHLRNLWRG